MHRFLTADLYDAYGPSCQSCTVQFRQYGGKPVFAGPIRTVQCQNDNVLVRQELQRPGEGCVLVVDGHGSMQSALVGDMLAAAGMKSGWAGLVIYGAVRDVNALQKLDFGVKALGSNPKKSAKQGTGAAGVAVQFGEVSFRPGHWLYSDDDGILVSPERLPDLPSPH